MSYQYFILLTLGIILSPSCFCQKLFINEIKPLPDTASLPKRINYPWVELRNTSSDSVLLSDYNISFDSIDFFKLPDRMIGPKQYFLIGLNSEVSSDSNSYFIDYTINHDTRMIYLIGESNVLKLIIPDGILPNESYGRYPEDSEDWIFYPENFITPGTINKYPGPWQKVVAKASFRPRDSTPNGVLVYDNKVWIFEGYKYMEDGTYYSTSDVHNSMDGVNWQMVNPYPPFNPYSAFIVFDGWMWAFEYRAYRSKDGINWEDAGPTPLSLGGRITFHEGKLYWTSGQDIYTSSDGINWKLLLYDGPWEIRAWPGFQSMNGKLWLFGGAGKWNTTTPHYYNDVWSSVDGINWVREIEEADFPGRYWFGSHVFDNKLWIFGGYNYYDDLNGNRFRGNKNDIWYSEDGVKWNQLITGTWPERHAPLSWVKGDNLFISSGATGYKLLNDIWRFEKEHLIEHLIKEELLAQIDTVNIYGDSLKAPSETFSGSVISYSIEDATIAAINGNNIEFNNAGNTLVHARVEPSLLHHGGEVTIPLVVNKRNLFVKVVDTLKGFGDPWPEFNLKYSGFVKNDNISTLTQKPYIITDAYMFSPLGEYIVESIGGEAKNYDFSYIPGTLKIGGKDELIVFPVPSNSFLNIIYSNQEIPILNIRLYNSNGNLVLDSDVNDYRITIDVSALPTGIYTLVTSLVNSQSPTINKIVVK